ncbi:uncharacterized protein JCM15063_003878 [Sporobolomyces koalae]|uniref:uncharacterized protein n=1 Tax=Sporobolomyces koalae TaxID=500713 RepID=UPI00318153E6
MPDLPSSLPAKPRAELTPTHLATLWKKTGEFDKLRKQLLADFLASADKDALVTHLDSILPGLLTDTAPPLSRIPRKDRPAHIMAALDRQDLLQRNLDKARTRLTKTGTRGSKGLGRKVERQLTGCARAYSGNVEGAPLEPDSQEEEGSDPEEDVPPKDEQVAKDSDPVPANGTEVIARTSPSTGPGSAPPDPTPTASQVPLDSAPAPHTASVKIETAAEDVVMQSAVPVELAPASDAMNEESTKP